MNKHLIRAELAKMLGLPVSDITDELQLNTIGWDSIVWVSLVAFLIVEFNCKIETKELMNIQTVGDLWVVVEAGLTS